MINRMCFFLVVASIFTLAPSVQGQWRRIPHPGADIRCVQLSGSRITAVGSCARWHMSTDLGASWYASGGADDQPTVVFYTIITVGDRTYIGGSNGSIMGGDILPKDDVDRKFLATGINSDVLTFADVSDSLSTRVLAGSFGEGIVATTDKGTTWTAFGTGLNSPNVTSMLNVRRPSPGSAAQLLAATYGGGIHRSTDGGLTWRPANQGVTEYNINQLCSSGGQIFAAGSGGNFFVSHDDGDSWQSIGTGLPETEILSLNVLVSSADTVLLAGTIDAGVWARSLSGGIWTAKNTGLENLRVNSIAVWDTLVLVGTNEGAYLSKDNSTTWTLISKAAFPQILSMAATTDQNNPQKTRLFVGSQKWLSFRRCPYGIVGAFTTSTMGEEWQRLPITTAVSIPYVFVKDSLVIFHGDGSVDCPSIFSRVSTDLGESWIGRGLPHLYGFGSKMKAYEKESQQGINLFFTVLGPNDGLLFSPDTGRSWGSFGGPALRYPFAVSGSNIYSRTLTGFARSSDFGSTWQDLTMSLNGAQTFELQTQGRRLFASGTGIWVSSDSAKSFRKVGLEGIAVPILTTHDSLLFAVGDGGLYCSKDSGVTWVNVSSNLLGDTVGRVGFSENHCFVTTSDGRELWYRPLSEILATPGQRPDAPVLISPRTDSVVSTHSARFTWSKPQFAMHYEFQLALDSAFMDRQVIESSNLQDTTLVIQELASSASYFWRVRSYNIYGYGAWSPVFTFRTSFWVGIPALVAPSDSSLDLPTVIRLTWHRAPSAEKYHVQLWNVLNGSPSFSVNDSSIVDTQRVVDTLRIGTWYNWSVRAQNASGYSKWASNWHFGTAASLPSQVDLVYPPHCAMISGNTVRLLWRKAEPQVSRYYFESATDSLFANGRTVTWPEDTAYTLEGLEMGASYWWRVKAFNTSGYGTFSETWKFSVSVTGIPSQIELPADYSLSQNYPNPFNPSTVIRYGLPKRSHVVMSIYSMLGQRLSTIVNDDQDAGYYEVRFDGSSFASGFYLLRFHSGDFTQTRKLLLVR